MWSRNRPIVSVGESDWSIAIVEDKLNRFSLSVTAPKPPSEPAADDLDRPYPTYHEFHDIRLEFPPVEPPELWIGAVNERKVPAARGCSAAAGAATITA